METKTARQSAIQLNDNVQYLPVCSKHDLESDWLDNEDDAWTVALQHRDDSEEGHIVDVIVRQTS